MLAVVACTSKESASPTGVKPGNIKTMVTPNVAASLTSAGTFPNVSAQQIGGRAVISPARASELALAYMREYGQYIRDHVEQLHGEKVDFASLRAEDQIVLSETPYESLPESATGPEHKAFGSYYLVRLSDGSGPVVTVAVSALSTDIQLRNGTSGLRATGMYGNEFRIWVVPKGGTGKPSLSPEQAVQVAFEAFGALIAEPPRLIRAGYAFVPQIGSWQLRFNTPVRVSRPGSAAPETTDVVYINTKGGLEIPTPVQQSETIRLRPGSQGPAITASLPIRRGLATSLVSVSPFKRH
jgi:hypothetical protein